MKIMLLTLTCSGASTPDVTKHLNYRWEIHTDRTHTETNAITFLSNKFNLESRFTLLQCTDGKAQEESCEMSSTAACKEKSRSVTATVGTDRVLTALSAGEMFSSPA